MERIKEIILKKIIRNKNTYYIMGVLMIVLLLLNSINGNFGSENRILSLYAKSSQVISSTNNKVKSMLGFNRNSSEQEIEDLKAKNEELKAAMIENMITKSDLEELRSLKSSLNYVSNNESRDYISTSIVYKNDGNFFTSFVIDAGENFGVQKDSIVIGENGLVGIIFEVNEKYSKGMSILDSDISISFQALRNKEVAGIASQNIIMNVNEDFSGYLKGYLFDKEASVFTGDILVTSGLGLYPAGIQIGEVEGVIEDKSNLLQYIKIKPYVNFKTIDKVIVINPRLLH
jgi:rod shape-determining protein mreC